ncbi:MAG: zinc ABC transporter substrate-binding protein [Methyloligellaceae bacterium]
MRTVTLLLIVFATFAPDLSAKARAEADVVVSIKPIHSLAAAIMQGTGTPRVIVRGNGSPHVYALKPSDARALENADLIFWVGPAMETFLAGYVKTLGKSALTVTLAETDNLTRLAFREGGPWSNPENIGKGGNHADHRDHATRERPDGGHRPPDVDMHFWLDPRNAKRMAEKMVNALARTDPENASLYRANGKVLFERLNRLTEELQTKLRPVRDKPFIVFHDAYHYFEKRFGLTAAGAIAVSPERQPGAKRLAKIRHKIRALGATCLFAEPQFPRRLLKNIVEGTAADIGILDPLGAGLKPGPDHYFKLMHQNATALTDCLFKRSLAGVNKS